MTDSPVGRRLRVAVLFDTAGFVRALPLTGAAARTLRLNAHLAAAGVKVRLYLCDLNRASYPTHDWPFPVTYLPYEAMYHDPAMLQAQLTGYAPDVLVMSNANLIVRYGRQAADAADCALIYEMHDDEGALLRSFDMPADAHRKAARLQQAAARVADGVVVFTDPDAACARRLTDKPVHVVPCGVEPGQAPAPSSCAAAAFVGNLYYEPNLRAVRYLHDTLSRAPHRWGQLTHIDVFGRYPPSLGRLGARNRLRLHGPVPDLRAALTSAAVGLAPLECGGGMKLKVLEYMAARLPVVGTRAAFTGLPEPHEYALVAADLDGIPDLVAHLLADYELRGVLGTRGRDVALSRFCWRTVAGSAREAYLDIATHATGNRTAVPGDVARLAADPPYWLYEWRTRHHGRSDPASHPWATASAGPDGMNEQVATAVACARTAAEAALDTHLDRAGTTGYGGRSVVFFGARIVVKVYVHRGSERLHRERAGLSLAAIAVGRGIPEVVGYACPAGALPWIACTRLPGTAADPGRVDRGLDSQMGRLAARLHGTGLPDLGGLPRFRRHLRSTDTINDAAYPARRRLDDALADAPSEVIGRCVQGFVHGDFSRHNILISDGAIQGLLDFERCGLGCIYEDLATFRLHDVLLGASSEKAALDAYQSVLATLRPEAPAVNRVHLAWHTARYATWILQWAFDVDPDLAGQVAALAPSLAAEIIPDWGRGRR